MPRVVVVPGLGPLLRAWREAQGRSRLQWAWDLWRSGSGMSPLKMRYMLAHAERTCEWKCKEPEEALGRFLKSSHGALIRASMNPARYEDTRYHEQVRDVIYTALRDHLN